MSWPPTVGETLPQAGSAYGIEDKLAAYCPNLAHEVGGAKARGVRVAGLRQNHDRVGEVTTVWELRGADGRPRLVTAYVERVL